MMDHTQAYKKTKQWLVVRLGHLGDVVLTTGVLRYWHETYGVRLHVLTKAAYAPVLAELPWIEAVHSLPEHLEGLQEIHFLRDLAKKYSGWGLVDLHGVLRSRFLSLFWTGPVLRYKKMAWDRRLFMATRNQQASQRLTALSVPQRYALAFEATAPEASLLLPECRLAEHEHAWATQYMQKLASSERRPVALHPFAAHQWKTWPEPHWRELADLLGAHKIPFIVIGRGKKLFPDATYDLVNATSLRQTLALLSQCSVLVTGDSGPMHLATSVGTPVVALFGPTTREWGFYPAPGQGTVVERELPCRPCSLHGKVACPHAGICLASITPPHVYSVLMQYLDEKKR